MLLYICECYHHRLHIVQAYLACKDKSASCIFITICTHGKNRRFEHGKHTDARNSSCMLECGMLIAQSRIYIYIYTDPYIVWYYEIAYCFAISRIRCAHYMRCNEKTWPINKINLTKLFFMGIRKRLELIDVELKTQNHNRRKLLFACACDRVIVASFFKFWIHFITMRIFDVQVHHEKINKYRGLWSIGIVSSINVRSVCPSICSESLTSGTMV